MKVAGYAPLSPSAIATPPPNTTWRLYYYAGSQRVAVRVNITSLLARYRASPPRHYVPPPKL